MGRLCCSLFFVCQAVFFGGQMKFFCVFGCGMVGRCGLFRGEMMAFWAFLACWLLFQLYWVVVNTFMSGWGGLLLCMRFGFGSIRFEDCLLVAAILVVGILMYK